MTPPIRKIGIFGGTFDPPHMGHLLMAHAALAKAGLERLTFMVSAAPPHKLGSASEPSASFAHRLRMVEIAAPQEEGFVVSDMESRLPRPSFTVDLLRRFREAEGEGAEIHFLIGADWIPQLASWKTIDEVFALCRFIVVPRRGFSHAALRTAARGLKGAWVDRLESGWIDAPEVDVSSTDVRERVASGLSIATLVPRSVEAYIYEQGLYGAKGEEETRGL
ncbi:MAG: nicotinate-nucleotide adenylyltransferase [Planctomycetota bacterium]